MALAGDSASNCGALTVKYSPAWPEALLDLGRPAIQASLINTRNCRIVTHSRTSFSGAASNTWQDEVESSSDLPGDGTAHSH